MTPSDLIARTTFKPLETCRTKTPRRAGGRRIANRRHRRSSAVAVARGLSSRRDIVGSPSMPAAGGGTALSVAVVGSGVVGLSCALALQAAGHHVRILDRASVVGCRQSSASYGHAGTFAAYANVPVNRPGIIWELPKLLSSSGPLSIKPTPHLLRMLPWFAHFLRNTTPDAVEQTAMSLGGLLSRAENAYHPIWKQASLDINGPMGGFSTTGNNDLSYSCRNGYLILQKSKEAMQASRPGAELRRRGVGPSLRLEELSPEDVRAMEPNLATSATAGGALWFPDGWFLRDPAALLHAMAEGFLSGGGELVTGAAGNIQAIEPGPGGRGVRLVMEDPEHGHFDADEVVVAAGAHSSKLAKSVGDWCPLDTERGHHIMFPPGSEGLLSRAVCDPTQGFVMTPMAGGMRAAGTVELGGTDSPLTPARCQQLEAASASILSPEAVRDLPGRLTERDWVGFRPSMPDALPVLGRSTSNPKVIYAFGHQHLGWTLGGITGEIVRDLVAGGDPSVSLSPFHPDRFSRSLLRSGSASRAAAQAAGAQ